MTTPIELQALDVLAEAITQIDLSEYQAEDITVHKRELDATDPNCSVGLFFHSWTPTDSPQIGMMEPVRGRYRFSIQTYIKASEREVGEVSSAAFVKKLRQLLYRDEALRLSLGSLREGDFSPIERALRWGVEATQYTDSAITGGFVFLSQTEFYFETEVA